MKLETFFDKFELFADAPDAVAKMRELVLNLAVQGRLVPNDLDHPLTAEQIRKQKQQKLHELKIRSHPDTPVTADSDFPFCLPRAWIAVTLGDLAFSCPTSYGGDPIPSLPRAGVVKVGNIDNQGGFKGKFTDRGFPKDEIDGLLAKRGDLMVVKSSGSAENVHSGKTALCTAEHDGKIVGSNFVLRLRLLGSSAAPEYVWRVLTSRYSRSWVEGTVQTMTYPNLKWIDFARLPIPLPPPAEQKRIVAKVDELMALCDRLEAQQQDREKRHAALARASLARFAEAPTPANLEFLFHKSYAIPPADLRKSILTLAVQGKLVRQDPNDESAAGLLERIDSVRRSMKTKHYRQVEDGETPYEVPSTWLWVRLGNVALTSDSGWSPQCESVSREGTNWGVLKVSAVSWGVFKPEENKALPRGMEGRLGCEVQPGDFLLSRANTEELVARSVVVEQTPARLMMSDKIVRFRFPDLVDKTFINLANSSEEARSYYAQNASGTSSSMKNIGREVMCNLPIPFPPLSEQHRIVAKVDELMALVDKLEAQLAAARTTATDLLAAAVAELTKGNPSHATVQN